MKINKSIAVLVVYLFTFNSLYSEEIKRGFPNIPNFFHQIFSVDNRKIELMQVGIPSDKQEEIQAILTKFKTAMQNK